jgi:hypothetical protein
MMSRYKTPKLGYEITHGMNRNGRNVFRVYDWMGYFTYVESSDVNDIVEYVKEKFDTWVPIG